MLGGCAGFWSPAGVDGWAAQAQPQSQSQSQAQSQAQPQAQVHAQAQHHTARQQMAR